MISLVSPSRAFLRWHGGKFSLAQWILEHMPAHDTYVEPYCGAAGVFFQKMRTRAEVLNDKDGELMNLFRIARDRGEELRRALELTPYARAEFVLSYRKTANKLEQARRTVVRSFLGFGGGTRAKTTGFRGSTADRNGQSMATDWRKYPLDFGAIIERLQGVNFECRPALRVITEHDRPDTVFYLDPPYLKSTRDPGRDYRHEMTERGHRELAEVLQSVKGMVMLSGYRSKLYDKLFADWHREEKRAIADTGTCKAKKLRTECLWMNAAAMARHPSPALAGLITITHHRPAQTEMELTA